MATSEESEWPEDWEEGASRRTISFYHAEGAPYLDDQGKVHREPPPEELEDLQRRGLVIPPRIVEEIVGSVVPIREVRKTSTAVSVRAAESRSGGTLGEPEQRRRRSSGVARDFAGRDPAALTGTAADAFFCVRIGTTDPTISSTIVGWTTSPRR